MGRGSRSDGQTGWVRLPRRRLAAPASRDRALARLAAPLGAASLAAAVCWAGYVALRPIEPVPTAEPPRPPDLRLPEPDRPGVDARRDRLAALDATNRFDLEGRAWTVGGADPAVAGAEPAERVPSPEELAAAVVERAGASEDAEPVTPREGLPPDTRAALDNLELKGLRTDRAGRPVAMLGLVDGGADMPRNETVELRAGDRFTDPKHDRAAWTVRRIETAGYRLVLERGGELAAVELFPSMTGSLGPGPLAVSRAGDAAPGGEPDAGAGGVAVERTNTAEALDRLRAAGASEAEILELVDQLARLEAMSEAERLPPRDEPALAPETAEAPADASPDDPAPDPAAAENPGPPPGLGGIFRMMRQQMRRDLGGGEPAAEPSDAENGPAPADDADAASGRDETGGDPG